MAISVSGMISPDCTLTHLPLRITKSAGTRPMATSTSERASLVDDGINSPQVIEMQLQRIKAGRLEKKELLKSRQAFHAHETYNNWNPKEVWVIKKQATAGSENHS